MNPMVSKERSIFDIFEKSERHLSSYFTHLLSSLFISNGMPFLGCGLGYLQQQDTQARRVLPAVAQSSAIITVASKLLSATKFYENLVKCQTR